MDSINIDMMMQMILSPREGGREREGETYRFAVFHLSMTSSTILTNSTEPWSFGNDIDAVAHLMHGDITTITKHNIVGIGVEIRIVTYSTWSVFGCRGSRRRASSSTTGSSVSG